MRKNKTERRCPRCKEYYENERALKFHQRHPEHCYIRKTIEEARRLNFSQTSNESAKKKKKSNRGVEYGEILTAEKKEIACVNNFKHLGTTLQ